MQIQPITHQPNFNGKLVIEKALTREVSGANLDKAIGEVKMLVADKPYDIFVTRNEKHPDFYDVAANKSLKEAKKVKEYTVKIQASIMPASFVDAAKDAVEMYEKYISKIVSKNK